MGKETIKIEELHSVKYSISQKCKYSAEIKCYGKTPEEALKNTSRIAKTVEGLIKFKNEVKE